jgi:hypothetical protein
MQNPIFMKAPPDWRVSGSIAARRDSRKQDLRGVHQKKIAFEAASRDDGGK